MKTSPNPITPQIVDDASKWFVEFRVGDVDAVTREQFIEWLRMSPTHIRAYLEVAGTYTDMAPHGAKPVIDVESLIAAARVDENIVGLPLTKWGRVRPRARRFAPPATAAAVSVMLLGTAGYIVYERQKQTYATQIGEQRSLTLPDGSQVQLNARSRIRVHVDEGQRRVELLEGQGLFEVAEDPRRPFTVQVGQTKITALGTAFDVNRSRRGVTVTVLSGRVGISASKLVLTPGQQVTLQPDALPQQTLPRPKAADVSAATAWRHRELVFEGTPLVDVVEEFNRHNIRQLRLEDRDLENMRISGVYASPDPASLLSFLRSEPDIALVEEDDRIRIVRRR